MKIQFIVLLLVVTICSCNEKGQNNASSIKTDRNQPNSSEPTDLLKKKNNTADTTCHFSDKMKSIIELLQKDDYKIDSSVRKDTLKFQTQKGKQVKKDYTFPPDHYQSVFAKRKSKLQGKEDNWYPQFYVYEICFSNEQKAMKYKKKLNEIIDNPSDLMNVKNYDYLVQNQDKIIYVRCGAKIFQPYAFQYQDTIQQMTAH